MLVYFLFAASALVVFLLSAGRIYSKLIARFADKEMIPKLTSPDIGRRRAVKMALDVAAVIFIGLALARPQWGLSWKQKTAGGLDILFAVDVSKSMLAADIKPDRLSYAKRGITDFVERSSGDRFGLIGFSGSAFLFCPVTSYYKGFFLTLDELKANSLTRGGTSIEAAIGEAIKTFSRVSAEQKILILISDGEETDGNAAAAADAAKKAGVQISCIGVGTREGSAIIYRKGEGEGEEIAVTDRAGRAVRTKLDEAALRSIAEKTGGIYARAEGGEFGLDRIYEERLKGLKKRQTEESLLRSYKEQFQYPLVIAFLALFISTTIGMTGKR